MPPALLDGIALGTARIVVPSNASNVQLFARRGDLVSEPLTIRVAQSAPPPLEPLQPDRTLYVLAVGVSELGGGEDSGFKPLQFAAKDARDFVEQMRVQQGRLYREVSVMLLTDRQASLSEILQGFGWLRQSVGPGDVGMVYFAGHGFNDRAGRHLLVPYDGSKHRPSTLVREDVLLDTLLSIRGRAVLFLDSCHAGTVGDRVQTPVQRTGRLINDLAAPENSVVVFASSTGEQKSTELIPLKNGLFTWALVQGLSGAATLDRTEQVTLRSLGGFIAPAAGRALASLGIDPAIQTPIAVIHEAVPDRIVARTVDRTLAGGARGRVADTRRER